MNTFEIKYLGNLRTSSSHLDSGSVINTDAPKDNHGLGEAFSPTDMVCSALASCILTIMAIAVEKYEGKFLIRGGQKITTEGNDFVRTAVIEFTSFDVAKKFFYSSEYQVAHDLLKDTVVRHHQIIEGS